MRWAWAVELAHLHSSHSSAHLNYSRLRLSFSYFNAELYAVYAVPWWARGRVGAAAAAAAAAHTSTTQVEPTQAHHQPASQPAGADGATTNSTLPSTPLHCLHNSGEGLQCTTSCTSLFSHHFVLCACSDPTTTIIIFCHLIKFIFIITYTGWLAGWVRLVVVLLLLLLYIVVGAHHTPIPGGGGVYGTMDRHNTYIKMAFLDFVFRQSRQFWRMWILNALNAVNVNHVL